MPEEFDADLRTTADGSVSQQAGGEKGPARRRDGPPPPLVGHSLARQVGNHTILELWGADAAVLNDEERLRKAMGEAAEAGRLVVLQDAFHSFEVRRPLAQLYCICGPRVSTCSVLSFSC